MLNAENLLDSIKSLEGAEIGLFLDENHSVQGTLLSVQKDHLIVKVKENILYFPINQIKALSRNIKETVITNQETNHAKVDRINLEEILKSMYLQWITVNSFNKQNFSGVLSEISKDYIVLINGDKEYLILKSQITNILNEQVDENHIAGMDSAQSAGFADNSSDSGLTQEQVQLSTQENIISEQKNQIFRHKEKGHYASANEEKNDATAKKQGEKNSEQQIQSALRNEKAEATEAASPSPTTGEEKNKAADKKVKKNQNRAFFQEVKFNSPMQECTWDVIPVVDTKDSPHQDDQIEEMENKAEMNKTEDGTEGNTAKTEEKEEIKLENTLQPLEETQDEAKKELEIQRDSGEIVAVQEENVSEEKLEPFEMELSDEENEYLHTPVKMLMEDNRRLLKYQYYALMKFAEKMYHIENQYRAIMKHAEKMYSQLKERRYY
ncbi:DUF2642 domain-containing protein [Ureibacillus sp. FSL K6-8385]|uniref:DUF2642 domain-containing protein n=1 Tax=Ureibacillus terrenus TaxID=118246 RepID=A0A540V3D3_9BACL|nr:DUF2642 domain-containing protein [Ureibacillus terrenus]MED3662877.1 DUF2642 domain-containing protein [Ureibacillus terrenus]TQE91249.1 DUF2642 domain-containing protein [Ureibacillus terrenus]